MRVDVTAELRALSERIVSLNKTEEVWAESESDDMFQTASFVGGYDADERAFCFSYYDAARHEYWFQLALHELEEVARGQKTTIEVRPAE